MGHLASREGVEQGVRVGRAGREGGDQFRAVGGLEARVGGDKHRADRRLVEAGKCGGGDGVRRLHAEELGRDLAEVGGTGVEQRLERGLAGLGGRRSEEHTSELQSH